MIETCWSNLKCFDVKFYMSALVGIITVMQLRLKKKRNIKILMLMRDKCMQFDLQVLFSSFILSPSPLNGAGLWVVQDHGILG